MHVHIIYPTWPKLPHQTRFDLPPLGPLQAAACLPDDIDVTVTDENVQPVDLDRPADLVGISMMLTCQTPRGFALADELRARGRTVVLGGLAVALHEDEARGHADAIVVGEAEGQLERLVRDFREGRLQPVYRRTEFADMADVPDPRRELLDKRRFYSHKGWELVDLVETSRGCRFSCAPCCTPFLGGRTHRIRPLDRVLGDLARCSRLLFLVDNSLEQDVGYQKTLFGAMAGLGKRWVSHPISVEPEVLRLARDAGAWYVYHAIFTVSDKIRDRVRMLHDHGIMVEGTILLGLDEHDEDFLKRFIDFLLTIELDVAEFTVLTPFPHTESARRLEAEGRILSRDWSLYDAGHVVFRPRRMTPDTLQRLYEEAWRTFHAEQSQTLRMSKLLLPVLREDRARRRASGEAPPPNEGNNDGSVAR
ncbi:MAG: cobalamin B12-binding domain-containing protein [Deltaproteobacteria bacterium]|nr:cobalamin B12-binding domain-containing protein [Deltaproteobacteria bacterium]